MIDITSCDLEGDVTETPVFEIRGTYDNEAFCCRIELRFDDTDLNDFDCDFEHLSGADLGPIGFDILKELVNEIYETEEYRDASEDLKRSKDADALYD